MVEVVPEHQIVPVDVFFGGEGEFEGVEVVLVRGVGEVGRGLRGVGGEAAVVLDSDAEVGSQVGGGDGCRGGSVDGEGSLVGVGWTGGYGEDEMVCGCHCWQGWGCGDGAIVVEV